MSTFRPVVGRVMPFELGGVAFRGGVSSGGGVSPGAGGKKAKEGWVIRIIH